MTKAYEEKRLSRLNEKLKGLTEKIQKPFKEINNLDELIKNINLVEAEIKEIEEKKKVDTVNRQHKERKDFLNKLISLDLPKEDIQTNDGQFHATKIKKYPSLLKFMQENKYTRFEFKDGLYINCKDGRNSYNLYKSEYVYNNPTKYTRFEDLETACKFNGIQFKPLTFKKFKTLQSKIYKQSEKLEIFLKEHSAKMDSFNFYFLENEKLINNISRSEHIKRVYIPAN